LTLSAALMCHPRRKAFVEELTQELPEAEVVWDRENDRWETGSRALLAFDPSASHHVIVQDDAVLCGDFLAGVEKAAQAAGERPIALYTGRVRPHQHTVTPAVKRAIRDGVPWLAFDGPWWGVGIVIPTAHIPDLVEWGNNHRRIENFDRRIEAFYKERSIDCWYTVPSLVDHRPVAENPSLIPKRTGNRQAHHFIGDLSPLEIDWEQPPLRLNAQFRRGERIRKVPLEGTVYRRLQRHPEWEEIAA
jgi:hypothetical protein